MQKGKQSQGTIVERSGYCCWDCHITGYRCWDCHVERETELGNNSCTGYCCWHNDVERETELVNNCRTKRILLLGLPYDRISLLGLPCRKGNGVREQLLYRILLLAQRCRKGNRVSKQLENRILVFGKSCIMKKTLNNCRCQISKHGQQHNLNSFLNCRSITLYTIGLIKNEIIYSLYIDTMIKSSLFALLRS